MTIALLPLPVSCVVGAGAGFRLLPSTRIIVGAGARPEAELLVELLTPQVGFVLEIIDDGAPPAVADQPQIRIMRSAASEAGQPETGQQEAYQLTVAASGVELRAAAPAGLAWAAQTLLQLLSVEAGGACLAAVEIDDAPRFSWRGAMLDPARHFWTVAEVLRFIDVMARQRLNRLHLHLTDDQGWRIEIRRYPRLTSVGAWRTTTIEGHAMLQPPRFDGIAHGGFYSQDEIRTIVAYAARRHITVVPEIDLPGHMQAAIAAYPWLGDDGQPCDVFPCWGVNPHILNVEERTLRFLEDVLAEVVELFPSPWIHVGGDEAVKNEWQASPRVQARIAALGVTDEHGMQSHIIKRMDTFLSARGRRLLGWDEILEGGLSPNATVVSWRGVTGGIEAARQGHDVIMAPQSHTYFDHYQHVDYTAQPLAIGGMLPLEKVYAFEPIPPELSAEEGRHVLGAQGQLWSEYITSYAQLEAMAFPRLCALAEVLWSPKATRDWPAFQDRLAVHLQRLAALGVNYFKPPAAGPRQTAITWRPRENDRPALVVLAAGSRLGGERHLAQVGPHAETILDFTAYDAKRCGFVEIILIVRPDNQALVAQTVGNRLARQLPVRYVLQDMHEPLPGVQTPGRSKPWGTAHAVACGLRGLQRPCGVVSADEWYSGAGMRSLAQVLARGDRSSVQVAYTLARTVNQHGPVSRALCTINEHGELQTITETADIVSGALAPETALSLDLWGFQPNCYAPFIADVETWIRQAQTSADECQLTAMVMASSARHGWKTRAVVTGGDWAGLAHHADHAAVQARLAQATEAGDYPQPLW